MGEKLTLVTIVYGDYIEMFSKACLRSVFQSGNIPYLLNAGYELDYTIYTLTYSDIVNIENTLAPYRDYNIKYKIIVDPNVDKDTMMQTLLEDCLVKKAKVLFLNPDCFISNKGLKNLVAYKARNNMCLAALHIRVDREVFLSKLGTTDGDISSSRLVSMGMDCLHPCWGQSFIDEDKNNSYTTGSAIEKIEDNMWAVTFRIPNVFLADFVPSDREILKKFSFWDHRWPSKLIAENRYKFVGSSDFFFAVELTNGNQDLPPVQKGMKYNDDFKVHESDEIELENKHTGINRNFLVIMRGEEENGTARTRGN